MSELLKINVNQHTEKKGNLTYLSWAWAWAEVLKIDPGATWVVHTYGPQGSEQPCMWIGETAMVHTSVTVKGLRRECMLPVMDNKNNALKQPDSRKISDAIMRCMTKAIGMHGLGLYLYAGEDLPESEKDEPTELEGQLQDSINAIKAKAPRTLGMQVRQRIQEHLAAGRELGALQEWQALRDLENGHEVASIVWGGLTTPERQEITRLQNEAKETV